MGGKLGGTPAHNVVLPPPPADDDEIGLQSFDQQNSPTGENVQSIDCRYSMLRVLACSLCGVTHKTDDLLQDSSRADSELTMVVVADSAAVTARQKSEFAQKSLLVDSRSDKKQATERKLEP